MKIFDLSQPIFNACPGWPSYEITDITYETTLGNEGYTSERININSHTGTHLDAPFHFYVDGQTIDEIPIERFIGRGVVVDLSKDIKPCQPIGPKELDPFLGIIQADDIILINTGWCKKRSVGPVYYHEWPYLTGEGGELLKDRRVKGVGIDGLSLGGWAEGTGRPVHEALLGNGIWIAEEMFFPDEFLAYSTCTVSAVPLRLQGFGGSPTRAYAVVED